LSSDSQIGIGIDVGAISANVVVMDAGERVTEEHYIRTWGRPVETVSEILTEVLPRVTGDYFLAFTGSVGKLLAELTESCFVPEVVAQSCSASHFHPGVRSIIEIGGETTKLILLRDDIHDGEAVVEDFSMNSLCAAGTGSFLDQQASRLGLSIEEFGALALKSAHPPRIAGRCSVFAKSDMIHLQQIATPDYDIVAGLCYAVARNFKSNIARGKPLQKPVAFQGGVAANPGVRRGFADVFELEPDELIVPKHYASMGAIGAVLVARRQGRARKPADIFSSLQRYLREEAGREQPSLEPLTDGHTPCTFSLCGGGPIIGRCYLGIDVGSISTNLVVIDERCNVIARRYLMTTGRPIEAIRQGLMEIGEEVGDKLSIAGVGTTGSGRYLAGGFVGADVIRNEITAQATAALQIDPKVDTIFEIGGQDSKYISLRNGAVVDFEMNKVCAAGTGSFLEEQAERLGIKIEEQFGQMALGAARPAPMGERCTVFIESDLTRYQQNGVKVEDLVAGLSYSIVHNYLNKVVGQRRVGEKIFFQGGTAFNQGVVAAFEKVVGRPITVPPHHDVTGAIGAAILAMRENKKGSSGFKGFDLSQKRYDIQTFTCQGCSNSCEIRKVTVEGEAPTFYGSRCEKYEVDKDKARHDEIPDLFVEREELLLNIVPDRENLPADAPTIGIPRALFLYEHLPFWKAFFLELGIRPVLSERTNRKIIHRGVETVVAEFCFPVKAAHGHVLDLIDKGVRRLFIPSVIDMHKVGNTRNSFNCPYVQAFPYTLRSAIDFEKLGVEALSPVIYFARGRRKLEKSLVALGRSLGRSAPQVKRALEKAEHAQKEFYRRLTQRGKQTLDALEPEGRAMIVISRPYNGCDPGINLGLPQKLRRLGVLPIPIDMMPWEEVPAEKQETAMYWKAGQRILQTARLIKDDPRLFAVYLTNFGCGPDSFVSHFFNDAMQGKPYLQIEIDEHSADAGVITRCEAFLDSLKNYRGNGAVTRANIRKTSQAPRTIYLPYMCDQARAVAAAFRGCGIDARMLEETDDAALALGRKLTSGRECYPCILTTGDMVKKVQSPGFDPDRSAFFMPSGSGPCRFGQYNRLHRLVLDELGCSQVPILSPNQDFDLYAGLGPYGKDFPKLAWHGLVAIDLLEKKLRETKPYEVNPGETESIYRKYLDEVVEAVVHRCDIGEILRRARAEMDTIPVHTHVRRPVVGIVGEIYVRGNRFSNERIIDNIEKLGGEVWMPPVTEWLFYINHNSKWHALEKGAYRESARVRLKDWYQRRVEHEYCEIFRGSLRNLHEPRTGDALRWATPFIHPSFEGEAGLSIGKAIDYIQKGVAGIVNTMPFTCMPGNIVTAVFKSVREQYGNIPVLNLSYDGQGKTNSDTRLEAFMYQVKQYHRAAKPQPKSLILPSPSGRG
jgi:predicted CoA-substrate-specific enzyme activase